MMQAANRKLTIAEIRDAVMSTARNSPPAGVQWDPRYGRGRVDATAVLTQFAQPAPQVLATQTVVNGARLATVNGIEPPTMVALISGMAETAQKLGARCACRWKSSL